MGLADDLTKTKQQLCTIGKILLKLSDQDRDALIAAFTPATKKSFFKIEQDLRKNGHPISLNTINAHYHQECRCYWGDK